MEYGPFTQPILTAATLLASFSINKRVNTCLWDQVNFYRWTQLPSLSGPIPWDAGYHCFRKSIGSGTIVYFGSGEEGQANCANNQNGSTPEDCEFFLTAELAQGPQGGGFGQGVTGWNAAFPKIAKFTGAWIISVYLEAVENGAGFLALTSEAGKFCSAFPGVSLSNQVVDSQALFEWGDPPQQQYYFANPFYGGSVVLNGFGAA
jgi:hypothetical protein